MFFKQKFVYKLRMDESMRTESKFIYTRPKQIPLFEEKEDGTLKQYQKQEH